MPSKGLRLLEGRGAAPYPMDVSDVDEGPVLACFNHWHRKCCTAEQQDHKGEQRGGFGKHDRAAVFCSLCFVIVVLLPL